METYQFNLTLQRLQIENFRGFEGLEIAFDEKLTVLIGGNGSGKSSILDLLAENFRQIAHIWFRLGTDKYYLESQKDIRYKSDGVSTNCLDFSVNHPVYGEDGLFVDAHENDSSILELGLNFNPRLYTKETGTYVYLQNTEEENAEVQYETTGIWEQLNKNYEKLKIKDIAKIRLPILAHYQAGSLTQNEPIDDSFNEHIWSIYDDLFENRSMSFQNLKKWFEWRQKLDYQRQKRGISNAGSSKITEGIYKDILEVLNDAENTYTEVYIDWEKKSAGEFVVVKNGDNLKENQLSSGEKMLFALVADISSKLAIANQSSDNPSKEGRGVVLIDEIDLHLHPKWQRKVVGKLREVFPNVQFVITTHSPAAVCDLKPSQINILRFDDESKQTTISNPQYSEGHNIEYVLSNIMGVNTDNPLVDDYLALMRNGLLKSKKGKEFQKVIDRLDPNSAEKMRVNFAIQRFKSIGKLGKS